jgi:hypothetical protein
LKTKTIPKRNRTYEQCKTLIDKQLAALKAKKQLKTFCEENNISYNTLSMFKNDKLVRSVAQRFMPQVLEALGYEVEVVETVTYKINKKAG